MISNEVLPVSVEIAPLRKDTAAHQINGFAQMALEDGLSEGVHYALGSVRNDQAVRAPKGRIFAAGPITLGFRHEDFQDVTDLHVAQARQLVKGLHLPSAKLEVAETRPMTPLPSEFTPDELRWKVISESERLVEDGLRLPSDMDTPGELVTTLSDTRLEDDAALLGRYLVFNGLGGTYQIIKPAVSGIYQIKQAVS